MDINQVPIGFSMVLAMNQSAMNAYAAMTEQQKQEVLTRAHNVRSKQEMEHIVNRIAK